MSWERTSHASHDAMRSTSISPTSTITSHSQSSTDRFTITVSPQLSNGNDQAKLDIGEPPFSKESTWEVLSIFLPTIRFMDYRRMRRQLYGVRKPLPKRRVFVFSIFCLFLVGIRYFFAKIENNQISIGLAFSTDFRQILVAIALIIGIIILLFAIARFQSTWSLFWAVNASYAFIVATLIYLIVRYGFNSERIDQSITLALFFVFGATQLIVIGVVKLIIHFGPRLALAGRWFSWAENYKLIEKSKKSVTFSRYNDFSGLCGNNICCLCLCCYRVTYRIIRSGFKGCRRRFGNPSGTREKLDPPFSHQIRYKGKVDDEGKPHGFGEWLADHHYGERIEGYWWHGYPVAPFVSQEVGSGSIFVGSRVGYVSCKSKSYAIYLGVSATELSISGHFFNDFPKTLFFSLQQFNSSLANRNLDCLPIDLLLEKKDDMSVEKTIEWCFELLNLPVHNPYVTFADDRSLHIYLDRRTGSLGIKGYQFVGLPNEVHSISNISVTVKRRNGANLFGKTSCRKRKVSTMNMNFYASSQISREEGAMLKNSPVNSNVINNNALTAQENENTSSSPFSDTAIPIPLNIPLEPMEDKTEQNGHLFGGFMDRYKKQSFERSASGSRGLMAKLFTQKFEEVWSKRDWIIPEETAQQIVADVFADEDEWKHALSEAYRATDKITVEKWKPINSLAAGLTPEEILIFIPGYNVTLAQGCAQLSHLVAFSKLPPYIYPFVFHWEGAIGGMFSSLFYPLAKQRARDKRLGKAFLNFMRILQAANVRRLHLLSHSAGTRAFMNGMECCQGENLFNPIQDFNDMSTKMDNNHNYSRMSIQTIIMINPDYPLNNFLSSGFQSLHALCNHIAVYGDTRDQVLSFSEKWNREKCLGKRIFDLNAPLHSLKPNLQYRMKKNLVSSEPQMSSEWKHTPIIQSNIAFCDNDSMQLSTAEVVDASTERAETFPGAVGASVVAELEDPSAEAGGTYKYACEDNNSLKNSKKVKRTAADNPSRIFSGKLSFVPRLDSIASEEAATSNVLIDPKKGFVLHREIASKKKTSCSVWLDLDVIDTTFVETHTDFLKHSFYQVNREIMDDIREIIVTGLRAKERIARLDRRRGNVFCFRVAPASVRSLYR